ncbi:GlsB/YeaQ/YmgE family stress response membrane protein [Nostoc sp.]|uniref:GlsB/YeaQ/YmgE family stress response membrane protein n=1 Tax=Nostoc sp. TaxID=1180 RepID=UPI002FF6D2AF
MLNIIAWIILGLIAGAIAKAINPVRQRGGIASTMVFVLGMVGAVIGGILVTHLITGRSQLTAVTLSIPGAVTLSIPGVIFAVIGAIIAIFLWNLLANRATY